MGIRQKDFDYTPQGVELRMRESAARCTKSQERAIADE